jgi:hypothetical protein
MGGAATTAVFFVAMMLEPELVERTVVVDYEYNVDPIEKKK